MNNLIQQKPSIYIPKRSKIYPVAIATTIFFFMIVNSLVLFGALPEFTEASSKLNIGVQPVDMMLTKPELPLRIVIPKLKLDWAISNPVYKNIANLDQALLKGVVRYPDSGMLGRRGNIVLMGHSSHLRYVKNKAYQAFNDINTLKAGDEINIYGTTTKMYTYIVTSVTQAKKTEASIDLKTNLSKLTLITCNNFGSKEDRYIVEAHLIK